MNKLILKKISAVALAVVLAAPTASLIQTSLLGAVSNDALVAYASGGPSNNASQITNTATVSSDTLDTTPGNNTAVAKDKFCFSTDIAVTSFTDGSTTVQANASRTFTAVITNNGVSKVQNIQFTYSLDTDYLDDSSISFATTVGTIATPTSSTTGSITTYTGTIAMPTFLQPASAVTLTVSSLTVKPTAVDGQLYTSDLTITPTEPTFDDCAIVDPNLTNNTGADSTTNIRVADLSLIKTSSGGANSSTNTVGRLNAGQSMSYTLSVTNNGPSAAEANVVVVDTWPSQITPTAVTAGEYTATAGWSCAYASPTMTCTKTVDLADQATDDIVINGVVNQTY